MIFYVDTFGVLAILLIIVLTVAAGLIDHDRTGRAVFTTPVTVPGPGMCGCGAPKCTPGLAPFPGDPEPMLAAPTEVPFTAEVGPSAALERAALLLPPEFDPKVDSLVGGIPPVRDGAL